MFPVIEGVPTTNIFVQAILREGNQVRINAPGFSVDTGPGPSSGMMGGMAGLAAMRGGDKGLEGLDALPRLDGTFTLRTPGEKLGRAACRERGGQYGLTSGV